MPHNNTIIRNIFCNYCVSPNYNIITNFNFSTNFSARINKNVVPYLGVTKVLTKMRFPYCHSLMNSAVFSYFAHLRDNDT